MDLTRAIDADPKNQNAWALRATLDNRAKNYAAGKHDARVVIKAPAPEQVGFVPIAPLYKVEQAFAQLGRWRRLSRCFEGTAASARAWLEVACFGYLFSRL